ncbi:DUF418 domain-containing protein [Kribbella deserti]|uniref:DUF418 domain-containing protein n=1 Tax=Kribbella deserti TaxID=1926257 RepID=A0ABV6QXG6_9ACTN
MTTAATTRTGPTTVSARAPGPDLARGFLLLFIALANTHSFLESPGATVRLMPVVTSFIDKLVATLTTVLVDGRSYTMFAALFGYGLVQITRREDLNGKDWRETRKLLRRRGRWLVVFGVLHAILLFSGDILAAYGLLAVTLAGAVRSTDRRLLIWAGVWALLGATLYGLVSIPMAIEKGPEGLIDGMIERSWMVLITAPLFAVTAAAAFLLGIWAARRRLLEEPPARLGKFIALGIGISVVGGAPLAWYIAGFGDKSDSLAVFGAGSLHALTGLAGGPAYALLVAVLAQRLVKPYGPVVTALQATGQRSMTCYLAQSVVWYVVFSPYLLDLGSSLRIWQTALLAIVTWAATVAMAEAMRRKGWRGPFEVLLRRLTYRGKAS